MSKVAWTVARAASFVLYFSGGLRVFERVDRGTRPTPRCVVISYHRVAWEQPGYHDIAVTPRTFRRHLEYLVRHGYGFLSLSQYHEYLAGQRTLDRDSVLITFDDGYRDNYTAAFPVLRDLGVPAAVFLCTGPIETNALLWWDRVALAVRSLRRVGVAGVDTDRELPEQVSALLLPALKGSDRRASAAIGHLVDFLKARPSDEREKIIVALERDAPLDSDRELMLTWDMVREMHRAGIEFGAHTVTHPVLSRLTVESARSEIADSKRSIERNVGVTVTAFAYPYGKSDYFDASTVDALRECGLLWAYTTENGRNDGRSDPLALRRNGMRDVPVHLLATRLAGVFEQPLLARLRARIERDHPIP